jgi:arginine/lysine/ornithine decarboxylase
MDLTEISGLDNLHNPKGAIAKTQELLAKIYHADESFILVNGSSCGIIAAICAVCGENETIIMPRNSHISAFHGLVFSGAKPIYYYPKIKPEGYFCAVEPFAIEKMIRNNPSAKAVLAVSPTYEGFVSDIKKILEICCKYEKILIVDEAHGAHFPFYEGFPKSASHCGADIVINSLHKTLPTMTQSAVLHVNGKTMDRQRLKYFLGSVQTTSPSYIFMGVVDEALRRLYNNKSLFDNYLNLLRAARKNLTNNMNIRLINTDDPGKLLFALPDKIQGGEVEEILMKEYKIALEMVRPHYVLALSSVADRAFGFARLTKGIGDLDTRINRAVPMGNGIYTDAYDFAKTEMVCTPREATFSFASETVRVSDSIGRVSAEFINEYPPGVPLLVPGERIHEAAALRMCRIKIQQLKVISCRSR